MIEVPRLLRAITLTALVLTTLASSRQTARFEISSGVVLIDEAFHVALAGLPPGQDVTVRVDGNRGMWQSTATFRSDAQGRVEIPDPMRLVWSAASDPSVAAVGAPVQPWVFTAEANGKVLATQTIVRRAVAQQVRAVPVRDRGLVGMAYYPAEPGPRAAVIVLGGSSGGVPPPGGYAGGLASRGYVVLALGYFNAEGLPRLLQNIPLEYFSTAVEWLKSQPLVDPSRIGVLGTSRGGELALLLGATYPSAFRVVVANVPSGVVWPGLSDDTAAPAWTLGGKPVRGAAARFSSADRALPGRERFLKRMRDADAIRGAEIPVERIRGPLLMFSAKDDQVWPSDVFATRVVERLKEHSFSYPVEHHSYDQAGHAITRPYVPTSDVRAVRIHPVSKRPIMFGGTPEGQARANEDSWNRLLSFLDKHLRN